MPRINLSVDAELFAAVAADANKRSCTVNAYILFLLEKLYKQSPFDSAALETLVTEAKSQQHEFEFTLAALPSFNKVSVAKVADATIKPSAERARLGKIFNAMVRSNKVGDVQRCVDSNGDLKFRSGSAVYVRK